MPLNGKTAVITESTSGICLGIAGELARAGAEEVLNSFTDTAEDHASRRRSPPNTASPPTTFVQTCPTPTPTAP